MGTPDLTNKTILKVVSLNCRDCSDWENTPCRSGFYRKTRLFLRHSHLCIHQSQSKHVQNFWQKFDQTQRSNPTRQFLKSSGKKPWMASRVASSEKIHVVCGILALF